MTGSSFVNIPCHVTESEQMFVIYEILVSLVIPFRNACIVFQRRVKRALNQPMEVLEIRSSEPTY